MPPERLGANFKISPGVDRDEAGKNRYATITSFQRNRIQLIWRLKGLTIRSKFLKKVDLQKFYDLELQ